MLKHAEAMSHTSSRDSRRKLQEDYNRVAGAYKSAAVADKDDWKKSVNSLDYEEIEPRSYERIKGSSLKVKSMENNLQKVGVPKAVWEQPGRKSMNVYNAHTASEMGYPHSSEPQKSTGAEPLPKYYLTRDKVGMRKPAGFL
ncbi:Oidioi.mRNA.OKI2018_I69.chr2.g6479.t1.cds [Oikopleura dioica]|uniref:Oidioi.mRNA.OKI2018_I69.chr2.g6479.t1.cds n=1 Tax=Oikopleura dioica TaxID=34765 RepID=A0ABN7T5H0_OIKDI|nr:Oidioi.mRNA.OKI2018_I69.chr2.g6479.t1.cds [Oikopleura dioica]